MKKFLFLSSAFLMTMAGAHAADKIITSANTCTVDVLGVSDNNATANTIATWGLIDYECPAGQYLLETETSVECTPCPTGSYCPGGTYTVESENMGTNTCPSTHPNSVQGAGADTQCYTACTVATANLAHATAVSGNDYFGTGVDTCGATACEMGYEVDGGGIDLVEKTPLVPISLTDAGDGYRYADANGTSDYSGAVDAIPADSVTAPNTWAVAYSDGVVYGKASCQPKADAGIEYIYSNIFGIIGGTIPMETVRSELEIRVGASKAEVYIAALSAGEGMSEEEQITAAKKYYAVGIAENANYSTSDTGQYCYCQMDGFTPTGGTKEIVTSAPWVFRSDYGSADNCALNCTDYCADYLHRDDVSDLVWRAVVVGALEAVETVGMCKITENNCLAGQYLAIVGDAMMCVPCKSGSYCPGGVYTIESENKGTNICPSGYTQSDAGASADTQCYTACTVDMVAHATAVTGNDYFGTGVDTCSATACETGYHVDGGGIELVEKTPLAPISLTDTGDGYRYVRADGSSSGYGAVDAIPADSVTAPNTWATAYSEGTVYGKASCQPASNDAAITYVMSTYQSVLGGGMTIEAFKSGLEPIAGSVLTDYAADILSGLMNGTKTEKDMFEALFVVFGTKKDANYSTDSVGEICYCQMDGFTPTGGTKVAVTSAPWVFYYDDGSADLCASNCASHCASHLRFDDASDLAFRGAVVGSLSAVETGKTCAANILNIVWDPANKGAVIENQCTYDGAITVPADPVKPGFTFAGWKLLENTTTE